MSGAEGSILIAICVVAAVCTLAVIALAITVVLTIRRRKSEDKGEVFEAQEEQPPAEQAETVQTSEEALAEPSAKAPAEVAAQTPAITPVKKVKIARGAAFVSARYDKSFTAKLIQSDDEVKGWYSSLKNALLGYKKVNSRISWRTDSINRGRTKLAKFAIRGKTLRLYLALNPDDYADTKYKVERTENKRYEEVPCLYRIKNARRAKYALELIATLAEKFGLQPVEREQVDYYLPYEENEPLLERGLIKEIVYKADEPVQVEEDGETAQEVAVTEIADSEPTEENTVEETAEEEQPVEEETAEEVQPAEEETATEATEEQPAEEAEEVSEPPAEEVAVATEEVTEVAPTEENAVKGTETVSEEVADSEPTEEPTEVEGLSAEELDDVQSHEEEKKDEDGIEVVGVMFRRRGRKVYWFDPDGKTWEKGEIALYKSTDNPPQEVIVVDNAKISPSKLHLPLKPLHKANRRPK